MYSPARGAITDTHCHLDFNAFDGDRADVLERAQEAGLDRILNPGIDLASSKKALKLAESHDIVYAAVGVHPNDALTFDSSTLKELRSLVGSPGKAINRKVAAIGEIGLDYYRDRAPRDLQRQLFRQQLDLAADLGLPVVVHNRQASDDILNMLGEWQAQLSDAGSPLVQRPGVLHSYSDDVDTALKAISLKFYIGFTGPVTFKKAIDLQDVAARLPLTHILVETDAPFLTPHPYRGQRNEPAYVRQVIDKIAVIRNLPFSEVAEATSANARRLFNW